MMVNDFILKYQSGLLYNAYKYFGVFKNKDHFIFRLYALKATKVTVCLSCDNYLEHEMISINNVFEYISKAATYGDQYFFYIYHGDIKIKKIDPFSPSFDSNNVHSIVSDNTFTFSDDKFINNRSLMYDKPLSIYEVYLGSFINDSHGNVFNYQRDVDKLIEYLVKYNFNAVELLPLHEHPYGGSWGYQATGFYGITSRYGTPKEFKYFVNKMHENNIIVLLDFVSVHFAVDDFGLSMFDGTAMFESDQKDLRNNNWGSVNFDFSKLVVQSFLISAAMHYIDEYHIDGLRYDAVSHLLFHWGDKQNGLNVDGVNFLKKNNKILKENFPNVMLIAEDSTDYYGVTKNIDEGGLGFDYKWDLGWTNDTFKYFMTSNDWRKNVHNEIVFSMHYFYSERFLLPVSHDEVVHVKGSVLNKMFGGYDEKFDQVKCFYLYMFAHPGKKLLFMGTEVGTFDEWNESKEIYFNITKYEKHQNISNFIKRINQIYLSYPVLSKYDYDSERFNYIKRDDSLQSVFAFYRETEEDLIFFVCNLGENSYSFYNLGVPYSGNYIILMDTLNNSNNTTIQTNSTEELVDNCKQFIEISLMKNQAYLLYHKKESSNV